MTKTKLAYQLKRQATEETILETIDGMHVTATTARVTSRLDLELSTVREYCRRLRRNGDLTSTGQTAANAHKYRLTDSGRERLGSDPPDGDDSWRSYYERGDV